MGVYTILVEPKPTVQVKRNEPDANDDMDVESSYKRSRLPSYCTSTLVINIIFSPPPRLPRFIVT